MTPKRKSSAMPSVNWLLNALQARGYPSRIGKAGHLRYTFGPLNVHITRTLSAAARTNRDPGTYRTVTPSNVPVLLTAAATQPGEFITQVHMSLEAFEQMLAWLIEYDPDRFLRKYATRKDTDG
mgnify:CR=1 FL=1